MHRHAQAAMDSVNEVDVLTANIDYVAAGRELRSRNQQRPPAAVAPGTSVAGAEQTGTRSSSPTGPPSAADGLSSAGAAAQAPTSEGADMQGIVMFLNSS